MKTKKTGWREEGNNVTKKPKNRVMVNRTEGFPGRESRENRGWADVGDRLLVYLMVFFVGEPKAEVFPETSLNSLALPSLALVSPRGLQFPLPVTQPPDSML